MGLGVRFPDDLSLGALKTMQECEVLLGLLTPPQVALLPISLRAKFEDLWRFNLSDRPRADNYEAEAEYILRQFERYDFVCRVTWGNPVVLDSGTALLREMCRELHIQAKVHCGISSIDSVLCDLGYDPVDGLVIIEGQTAIRRHVRLQPEVATLVMQPGTFGSGMPHMRPGDEAIDLTPLGQYLESAYGPDHPFAFVRSIGSHGLEPMVFWSVLSKIVRCDPDLLRSSCIFVPARLN